MPNFVNSDLSPASPEFEQRVQKLLGHWDAIAQSGSSLEGLQVMASIDALPESVRRAAMEFQRWTGENLELLDSVENFRDQGMRKLAELAPAEESNWRELVAYAFSFAVQLGGWNVSLEPIDDPEFTEAWELRRAVFSENYAAAKAKAGLLTYEEVAAAAGLSKSTILSIEKHGIVPRRAALERLAPALGLSHYRELFKGLEDVPAWQCLFEDNEDLGME